MKTLPLEKSTQIALFVSSIVFGLINPPVVALRFAARRRAGLGGRFGWSDAAIVASLLCTTTMCICAAVACVEAGVGWHLIEALEYAGFGLLPTQGQTIIAFTELWAASVFFTKISVLLLFTELFDIVNYIKVLSRVLMGFAFALWLSQFIGLLTICLPIWNWWSIAAVTGWCGQRQSRIFVSTSIVHSIIDCCIFTLPIRCVWALKLPVRTRVGLLFVFSAGLIAIAVSIGRVVVLAQVDWYDITYAEWQSMLLSIIEPSIGIWIACVPHIRTIFTRQKPTGGISGARTEGRSAASKLESGRCEIHQMKSFSVTNESPDPRLASQASQVRLIHGTGATGQPDYFPL